MTRRAVLVGPMRGLPEFNFPAFDRAREHLRAVGWRVFCPAEADRAEGFDPTGMAGTEDLAAVGFNVTAAMRRNIAELMDARTLAVVLLPGWQESTGAAVEYAVSEAIGLELWYIDPAATITVRPYTEVPA